MPSLPYIGAEAVILGMAAFNANAKSVQTQLYAMAHAGNRLDRASSSSMGGIAAAFENMQQTALRSTQAAAAAVQTQMVASNVAAIQIAAAEESVAIASQAATAQITAALASRTQAEALHAVAVAQFNAQIVAADQALAAAQVAAAMAERQRSGTFIAAAAADTAAAEARAIATIAATEAQAAAGAAAAAQARISSASVQTALVAEAEAAKAASVSATAHAAAMEREAVAAAATAGQLDKLAKADFATAVAASEKAVVAEGTHAAAVEAARARMAAATARYAAVADASAANIAAANAAEAQAVIAAGTAITAAEAEKAAVTQASAAKQIASDQAVAASKQGLAVAVVASSAIIVAAIAAIGVAASVIGMKYISAVNTMGAFSGETAVNVDALGNQQLEMSRATLSSATALNTISQELLKAGTEYAVVTQGALMYTNALVQASAGELNAADAAATVQVSMEQFHTSAEQAANAATAAVQSSTLTFTGYADALRQGGLAASQFGMNVQEYSAMVATAGQTITSGTVIGTGFRQMLQSLKKPTKDATAALNEYGISLYDSAGAARLWPDILSDLEEKFSNQAVATGRITQAERDRAVATIFSTRASNVALAVINQGTQGYNDMLQAQRGLLAVDLANKMLIPTTAQLTLMKNNVMALAIAFYQGLDPIINVISGSFVKLLQSIPMDAMRDFGTRVISVVVNALGTMWEYVSPLVNALGSLGSAVLTAVGAFMSLSPIQALLAEQGMALLVMFRLSELILHGFATAIKGVADGLVWLASQVPLVNQGISYMVAMGAEALGFLGRVAAFVFNSMVDSIQWLLDGLAAMLDNISQGFTNIADYLRNFHGFWGAVMAGLLDGLSSLASGMATIVDTANLMVQGWQPAWQAMVDVVMNAVTLILKGVNFMLDGLSQLPLIGEAIGGARAAVAGFFGKIPSFAAAAGSAFGAVGASAVAMFNTLKAKLTQPLPDFAGALIAKFKSLQAARNQAVGNPGGAGRAGTGSDAGENPTKDDGAGEKAAKKLEEILNKTKELVRDFNDKLDKESAKVTGDIVQLYVRAYNEIAKSIAKADEAIAESAKETAKSLAAANFDRDLASFERLQKESLSNRQDAETKARQLALEDEEVGHQEHLSKAKDRLEEERRVREDAFDNELELQGIFRDRKREDEDNDYERGLKKQEDDLEARQQVDEDALKKRLDTDERGLEARQDVEDAALKTAQDKRERALDDAQDAQDRALQAQIDANERALDAQIDALEAALDKSQDIREAALKGQLDADKHAYERGKALAEINSDDAIARATAQAEYQAEIAKGVKQSIAQGRLNTKLTEIAKDTTEDKAKLAGKQKEDDADLTFEQAQNAKLLALRATFEQETVALKAQTDAQKLVLQQASDAQELALEQTQSAARLALQATFDGEALALNKTHEDAKVKQREDAERDTTEMHDEQERKRRELSDKLEKETLARSRFRENEDREYSKIQDEQKRENTKLEDLKAATEERAIAERERIRKRIQDNSDTEFKRGQEKETQDLADALDAGTFTRKIERIRLDGEARVNKARETLAEEQELTRTKLAEDVVELAANMKERTDTIQREYLDKLQDMLEDSKGTIGPLVDKITGDIQVGLDGIRDAAQEATAALLEAFTAQGKLAGAQEKAQIGSTFNRVAGAAQMRDVDKTASGYPDGPYSKAPSHIADGQSVGGWTWSDYWGWYYSGNDSPSTSENSYAKGGTIPGPYGSPVGITAHGGEKYMGIGGYATTLAAIEAAESMWRGGIGAPSSTVNNSWNVEANYGRVQPEGSIARDLSALAMLTSR